MNDDCLVQPKSFWRYRASAWLIWIIVAVTISLGAATRHDGTVTPAYRFGSESWFAGKPLYDMIGYGFVYLPQSAIFYAPWALLPIPLGDIVWRCAMIILLAISVDSLTRLVRGNDLWFLVNSAVAAGIGMGAFSNGQATVMMAALMILACVSLSESRWNLAATLLTTAIACKPTSVILILLVGAIFPRMRWRLAISLCCFALAPFLTQRPDYVISQYVAFVTNSRVAYVDGETGYWAHFYGMLKVIGVNAPSNAQQMTRLFAGLLALAACWTAERKLPPKRACFFLYAVSTCYLLLLCPRIEGCTYVMIGPVYGILLINAWIRRQSVLASIGMLLAVVSTVFSFDLATLVANRPNEVWLNPFICLFVTGYVISELRREMKLYESSEGIVRDRSATLILQSSFREHRCVNSSGV